jgi:hypothetical protein
VELSVEHVLEHALFSRLFGIFTLLLNGNGGILVAIEVASTAVEWEHIYSPIYRESDRTLETLILLELSLVGLRPKMGDIASALSLKRKGLWFKYKFVCTID